MDSCHILEMACIVTDGDLNILAEVSEIQYDMQYTVDTKCFNDFIRFYIIVLTNALKIIPHVTYFKKGSCNCYTSTR